MVPSHDKRIINKQTNKVKQYTPRCLPCLPVALGPPSAQWLCSLMAASLLFPHAPKGCVLCKWRDTEGHAMCVKQSEAADPASAAKAVKTPGETDPQFLQGHKGVLAKSKEAEFQMMSHLTFPLYLTSQTGSRIKRWPIS